MRALDLARLEQEIETHERIGNHHEIARIARLLLEELRKPEPQAALYHRALLQIYRLLKKEPMEEQPLRIAILAVIATALDQVLREQGAPTPAAPPRQVERCQKCGQVLDNLQGVYIVASVHQGQLTVCSSCMQELTRDGWTVEAIAKGVTS